MTFIEVTLELLKGFEVSLLIFALTLLFSLPLGLLMMLTLQSKNRVLHGGMSFLIWVIRGTPLMLQLLIVFFAPGLLFGSKIFGSHRFLAAILTFVINYAGYFAVIFKGGIDAIPRGQFEAGKVLGLRPWEVFRHIIFLQIIKHILMPISNEVITLVKDTSLVRVIAVIEIIKVAERFTAQGLIWPLFYTAVFYLIFSGLLSYLFSKAEEKLSYFEPA